MTARSRSGWTRPIAEPPWPAAHLIGCSPTERWRDSGAVPGGGRPARVTTRAWARVPARLRMSPVGENSIEGALGDRLGRSRTRPRPANHEKRPAEPGVRCGRRLAAPKGYFADFRAVRRQRVQTSALISVPLSRMVNGWRLGW